MNLFRKISVLLPLAAALAVAGLAVGAAGAAGDSSITVGPSTVLVNPKSYGFAVNVTCPTSADAAPCNGLLDIKTVPIKPYRSIPKKTWVVGALPFSVPAGTTAPVRGRLLAGALVQAKRHGKVKASVRVVRDEELVGSQTLTLKLTHR